MRRFGKAVRGLYLAAIKVLQLSGLDNDLSEDCVRAAVRLCGVDRCASPREIRAVVRHRSPCASA